MAASQGNRGGRRNRGSKWQDIDLLALQSLQSLPGGYLPWSKLSLRPAALATVLNDIQANRRRTVVECGSGVSTVYIARLLRGTDARVRALEHDGAWASTISRILDDEGLSDIASVVHAPLEPHPLALEGNDWYAQSVAEGFLEHRPDLLLVDGPNGGARRRLARYPALPFFRSSLAPGCTVVLDDIQRPGEQELLARWEEETGMEFRRLKRLRIGIASPGHVSSL